MKTRLQVAEEVANLVGNLRAFDFDQPLRGRLLAVLEQLRPYDHPAVPIPPVLIPGAIAALEEAGRIVEDPKNLPWEEVEDLRALLTSADDENQAWRIYTAAKSCSHNFTSVSLEAWSRRLESMDGGCPS